MSLLVAFRIPLARELGLNARQHWASKYRLEQEVKSEAYNATKAALQSHPGYPLAAPGYALDITFFAAANVDLDGCLSRAKYALDGIAWALGVDDACFCPIRIDREAPSSAERRRWVVVKITPT